MKDLHKWVMALAVAAIAVVMIFGAVGGNSPSAPVGGSSDSGWNATGDGCIAVDGSCVISSSGAISTSGSSTVGAFTQGGSILNIATSASAYTLTQAELSAASVIEIEAVSGAQSALALTLGATSTSWTSLIPTAGQSRTWIIEDNHTAGATTTTITAGTGIDLIAYTVNDDVIDGGEFAQLTCWRKENTDVGCITTEVLAAD
jgi:hypothetical protein